MEEAPAVGNAPFDRQGMWVWYVERSHGGSVPAIVAQAKRAGIGTVYIKAGDGGASGASSTASLVGRCTAAGSTSAPGSSSTATGRSAEAQVGAAAVAGAPTAS